MFSLGAVYWILMLIWLLFGFYWQWHAGWTSVGGGNLLLFALLAILGWKQFGPPLHR